MVCNLFTRKRSPHSVKYQFRLKGLRNIAKTYLLDKENGNTLWTDNIEIDKKLFDNTSVVSMFRNKIKSLIKTKNIPLIWTFLVNILGLAVPVYATGVIG